jgi:queuine tRNA-ribosyltransferase
MPVGTLATVKGVTVPQLAETGARMVLANTFHLHLQPGEAIVAEAGGLHRFMGWDGPILTDSGGFQVFSLADINRIDDEGVSFRSPRDGRPITLTPESSMAIQMALGADVAMAFDQCPPYPASEADVAAACRRTHAWLERCLAAHQRPDQQLFGIVQGGCFPHLRQESARLVASLDLPGIAVGGVSVGEPPEEMHRVVRLVGPLLPEDRPRYLMGVGSFREMAVAVAQGFDLFDCVLPTRLGRHGTALVAGERWNLRNARFRHDHTPLASQPRLSAPPDAGRGDAGPHLAEPPQPHHPAALQHGDGAGDRGGLLFRGFRSLGAGFPGLPYVVVSRPGKVCLQDLLPLSDAHGSHAAGWIPPPRPPRPAA